MIQTHGPMQRGLYTEMLVTMWDKVKCFTVHINPSGLDAAG